MMITPFKMELAHGDLQNSLQHGADGPLGLMPELLKAVVTGIPITGIEQLDGGLQARIGDQLSFFILGAVPTGLDGACIAARAQRLAGFFIASLRSRIDSGVTSSISSGPMYSSALSRVI